LTRHILLTALYLALAWVLMVTYQIFTQTALATAAASLATAAPLVASWLSSSSDLASFICSFAWMFVLSAVFSTLMFGKERRLSIQFLVSLGLTLVGSTLLGALSNVGVDLSNTNILSGPAAVFVGNAAFSWFYLALPFIVMLVIDLRSIIKKNR
jgi:hypothetical protein